MTFFYEIVPCGAEGPNWPGRPGRLTADTSVAGNELTAEAKAASCSRSSSATSCLASSRAGCWSLRFRTTARASARRQGVSLRRGGGIVGLVLRGSQYNRGLSLTAVENSPPRATDDPMGLRASSSTWCGRPAPSAVRRRARVAARRAGLAAGGLVRSNEREREFLGPQAGAWEARPSRIQSRAPLFPVPKLEFGNQRRAWGTRGNSETHAALSADPRSHTR